jgi:hypothetical protein
MNNLQEEIERVVAAIKLPVALSAFDLRSFYTKVRCLFPYVASRLVGPRDRTQRVARVALLVVGLFFSRTRFWTAPVVGVRVTQCFRSVQVWQSGGYVQCLRSKGVLEKIVVECGGLASSSKKMRKLYEVSAACCEPKKV